MAYSYVWKRDDIDAGEFVSPIAALDAAMQQAEHDAACPGGPSPLHILDGNGVVVAAFKDSEVFNVIAPVTETVTQQTSGGDSVDVEVVVGQEVSETKAMDDVADDDQGVVIVTQEALSGAELAAYADALAQREG